MVSTRFLQYYPSVKMNLPIIDFSNGDQGIFRKSGTISNIVINPLSACVALI